MKNMNGLVFAGLIIMGLSMSNQALGQDCYDYSTEEECQQYSSCEWIPRYHCMGENTDKCKMTLPEEECKDKGCTWFDGGYGFCQPKLGKR